MHVSIIHIRRALDHDAPRLHTCFQQAILHSTSDYYDEQTRLAWSQQLSITTFTERVTNTIDWCIWLAECDNNPAGFISLNRTNAFIEQCYVHPHFMGKGIGRMLVDTLEQYAYSIGLKTLTVNASLTASQFYSKQGYRAEYTLAYPLSDTLHMEVIRMKKRVAS